MNDEFRTINEVKHTLIDLAIRFGPRVLVALVFVAAGVFVGHWASRLADRGLKRIQVETPVRLLLVRAVKIIVVGLFLLMAVQNLGVELLPLVAGLGVAGAGVALAMQGVLGNLVAGLTVIFTKPFLIGEYISIASEEGEVSDISLFNTVLVHADRSRVVIPNRKVVGEILHNYGRIRQLDVIVKIAHTADLDAVLSAVRNVLDRHPLTLKDPAPMIAVNAHDPPAIGIAVKPWVAVPDYASACSEVRKAVIEALHARNIPLPVARQDVRLLAAPE
jgi:small conductance mechanosensitive channel